MGSEKSNRRRKGRSFWDCCIRSFWHEGISQESAIEILMKRYAQGEINKEEFEQMKQDIAEA